MQQKLLFLVFSFALCSLLGQENKDAVTTGELRENIHLHLNKTVFLKGERLWFKAYVHDQFSKLPSLATTNLHVGIYDKAGKEVKRKLLYVENGMAQGDFAIDSTMTGKEHMVLAWTNYMRNFKELEPFRQRITILRDGAEVGTGEVDMKISVYPEGGDLIADAYNNIGILVDNGLGQGVSVDNLELVDGTGKVLRSNITTNEFGMGKTGFMVERGKTYYLQRQRPGLEMVRSILPRATTGVLGLNIENNGKDQVLLKLLASRETFDTKDGDVHTVAIYQDDFVLLEDLEVNEEEAVISIARDRLPFGVLTAVLFDSELRPMAHRMFFNHREKADPQLNLEVEYCLTEFGDSIQVDLILPKGIEEEVNVSLSALPWGSLAHNPDNSLVSAFTLRPYAGQSFQDGYFFQQQDRKKRFELDKRLLIEGWGKYDWDSRKSEQVKIAFEMESGVGIMGKVIDADLTEEQQIYLVAQLSGTMKFNTLQIDKSFKENMVLFEGDSLGVSLIGKKGKLRKPKAEIQFTESLVAMGNIPEWLNANTVNRHLKDDEEEIINEPLNIGKRTIELEEVTVTEQAIRDNKYQLSAGVEGRVIGPVEMKRYKTVAMYLRKLGFGVKFGGQDYYVQSFRWPYPIIPVSVVGNAASSGQIMNLTLDRVRAITYRKLGKEAFIAIVLRDEIYLDPERRNKFIKFSVKHGYARPQDYFAPNYPDYSSLVFKQYGAIWWDSSVEVSSDIPTSINIPTKNEDGIQLHLEGMSQDGTLISLSERFNLDKR